MRVLLLAVALFAGAARAVPVDRTVALSLGDPQFVRQNYVEAFEVDPPDLCQAEQTPALEILLTPRRTGQGLLYLYEEGRLEVYRLVVSDAKAHAEATAKPADPALWKAARAVCPGLTERLVDGERFLHAQIPDALCRTALLPLLAESPYPADHLRLLFGVPALQAQLGAMQDRLRAAGLTGLALAYEGATLTIKSPMTADVRHRALKAIWPVAVGRLNFEDQDQLDAWGSH
ncbi:MAG: hypothetical protein ACYDCL_06780 [Myxococcales bacterium]